VSLFRGVHRVMGTVVTITVPADRADVVEPAFARLEWVDRTFSVYRTDSQISRIGAGMLSKSDADPLVQRVLDVCDELEEATAGWFQPRAPERGRPLDPSAYVKGWAVDLVIDDLIAAGITSGSVVAGGDAAVIGTRPDGSPWRAGIRRPDDERLAAVVGLVDAAIATSGTYESGDHIWGRGSAGYLGVSVAGPSLGTADAVATALFADGGTDLSWLGNFGLYEHLVICEDSMMRLTPGMERRLLAS
jgi:thiamine biosynthesis lipoprotein